MKPYKTAVFDNARWSGFEPREDDVFICTPPKCGTTWTQTIVVNLLWPDGDAPGSVMELSPWIEASFMFPTEMLHAMLAAQPHRRVMKSHTPADGIPWFNKARYLFVARDGRDAMMSMVNHLTRLRNVDQLNERALAEGVEPLPGFDGDLHRFFDTWLHQELLFFDILASYWAKKNESNLLFVHFNDLKQDLEAQMRRIAAFLDIHVAEEKWPATVKRCTFESMRENEAMMGDMSIAFEGGTKGFLNKGTNGQWRDVLTPDELDRYQARLEETLPADAIAWLAGGVGPGNA